MNICGTFWDVFDEGGGPSGHSADKGSGPTGQTLVRQPEEVRHAVTDAPYQAGRTAQDLQRSHDPTWDSQNNTSGLNSLSSVKNIYFFFHDEEPLEIEVVKNDFFVPSLHIANHLSVLWRDFSLSV